jgi:hypothetical protein
MKNLIKAIEQQEKKRLGDFIFNINQVQSTDTFDCKGLQTWQYNDLLPKGKDVSSYSFNALKGYLISRKEKSVYKSIEREVNKVKSVFNAGTLIECKISMEWKRSQMWGNNPTAEAWYSYKDADGNLRSDYVKSASIGGCGYDKGSTAVAQCLNQINEVLKPLYAKKNKSHKPAQNENDVNRTLFGYGSGYGILPSIQGGVGVSCYPQIFESIGYKFSTQASGKTFDVYTITKK